MPSLSDLISPKTRVQIMDRFGLSVELDASKEETHSGENDVTDYPVEEGANIADHSRPRPRRFAITGLVTGTPLDLLAIAIPPAMKARRGKQAWERLDDWRRSGERLHVITSFRSYVYDVVIDSIMVPRNARNTDGVEMTIGFKQVLTVSSKTVSKPERTAKNAKTNAGSKSTTPANAAQTSNASQTVLRQLQAGVGRVLLGK